MAQSIESLPALPRRPSALINLACDDAEKIYNTPGYAINMAEWHRSGIHTSSGKCEVCFAGAVMAGTLGAEPKTDCTPQNFGADAQALRALNHFRIGDVRGGLCELKNVMSLPEHETAVLEAADLYNTVEIPQPSARGKGVKFIRAMRKLAARLKALGW